MKQLELPFKEKERPRNFDEIMAELSNYVSQYPADAPRPFYSNGAQTASTSSFYVWSGNYET